MLLSLFHVAVTVIVLSLTSHDTELLYCMSSINCTCLLSAGVVVFAAVLTVRISFFFFRALGSNNRQILSPESSGSD